MAASLLAYAAQVMPDWNTDNEGDMGVMLLELFAYVADVLSYYTDRVAQEAYLPTATQRLSLLNIAQLLGYTPSNGVPATGTVEFQTTDPGLAVYLPAGTQVQSNFSSASDQPLIYQTNSAVTCPENGGTVVVDVTQGETFSMVPLGVSSGTSGQQLILPDLGVLDGSTQIFVQTTIDNQATGVQEWTQVSNFVDSNPGDMVFTVQVNALGQTIVTFGDNVNGLIPGLGLNIYTTYTTTQGSAGNQPAGAVAIMVDDIPGVAIALNATGVPQSSAMTGGTDPESNDSIRANAPVAFSTQQRAVSLSDFTNLTLTVPGVSTANAVANHSTSINLYFLGPGGSAPTTGLTTNVLDFFTGPPQRTLAGVTLSAPAPNLIPVDVGSSGNTVQLQIWPSYSQQNTVNNVELALTALLTPPNVQFGQLLQVSSIYEAIMAVAGVAYVIVPVFTREDNVQLDTTPIQFRQSEVPIPGTYYISPTGGC